MRRIQALTVIILAFCGPLARADDLPPPLSDSDFLPTSPAAAKLGQLLFYDPILSGSREVACATCHHPRFATSDGLSLGLGDGAHGLGPERRADAANLPEQRVPRNATALFNLGAREVTAMFTDGRVEADPSRPSGLRTPLEDEMVAGFSGVLSAQTMFPVLSPDEMAGHYGESDVSKAVRQGRITGPGGAWDILAARVAAIPDYAAAFAALDPEIAVGRPIAFTDISDAIADFIAVEWRAEDSPFDQYLRHGTALPEDAGRGMALFYGEAGCAVCHSGPLLSDQGYHATGSVQIGPGKAERFESHQRDIGRMRVTGRAADAYAFRTPMLRNVTHTGPWGHAGAFTDLAAFLRHHADPRTGLAAYAQKTALPDLPGIKPDDAVLGDAEEMSRIADAVSLSPVALSDAQIADLMAFLGALSDPVSLSGRLGIPETVPSGLPVPR